MKDFQPQNLDEADLLRLQGRANAIPRILVVEDEPCIRQLNTKTLTAAGFQVDAAEDGAAAWATLQQNRYDLLVTDNDMPRVSGVELLHKLHAAHMALPVIMATGIPPKDEFLQYPWIQPAALLVKPYSFNELLGTVREILRMAVSAEDPAGEAPPMKA